MKNINAIANQEYSGDRVEALMVFMQSGKHGIRDRNKWGRALYRIKTNELNLCLSNFVQKDLVIMTNIFAGVR